MENKWKENEIEIKHNTCFQKLRLKDDNSETFFIQKKTIKKWLWNWNKRISQEIEKLIHEKDKLIKNNKLTTIFLMF